MSTHPIVHIEISAQDREAAGKFYSDIFGWKVKQMPEMDYATFEAEGGPGGGFNPLSSQNPAGTVLVYIATDDIDGDLERVEKHGGKILMRKSEIPGVGWWGVFRDPTGNLLALFTPAPMAP